MADKREKWMQVMQLSMTKRMKLKTLPVVVEEVKVLLNSKYQDRSMADCLFQMCTLKKTDLIVKFGDQMDHWSEEQQVLTCDPLIIAALSCHL